MGGNTIKALDQLLDRAFLALYQEDMVALEEVVQTLLTFDFSTLSSNDLIRFEKRWDEIIRRTERMKSDIVYKISRQGQLKKYNF